MSLAMPLIADLFNSLPRISLKDPVYDSFFREMRTCVAVGEFPVPRPAVATSIPIVDPAVVAPSHPRSVESITIH
ncbi:MAG: hypothetical protein ACK526_01750 [Planctomyces sp.]